MPGLFSRSTCSEYIDSIMAIKQEANIQIYAKAMPCSIALETLKARKLLKYMVVMGGLEPPTPAL